MATACHHVAEKSSRQGVKVASPEPQSQCPPAEVVTRVLFPFCLWQGFLCPPVATELRTTLILLPPPPMWGLRLWVVTSRHQRPSAFHFVCPLSSCLVGPCGKGCSRWRRWWTEKWYLLRFRCCTDVCRDAKTAARAEALAL